MTSSEEVTFATVTDSKAGKIQSGRVAMQEFHSELSNKEVNKLVSFDLFY